MLLAHGLGGRTDLPIPVWLALYGAGIAVVISFAALGLLWPKPRLTDPDAGRPLPDAVRRAVDSAYVRLTLRLIVLAIAITLVLAAFLGSPETAYNPAPWFLYITFWVGLLPLSVLFGRVWRLVNPLRTIHTGLSRLSGTDPETGTRAWPERLGYWPAAVWLAAFVWLELVYPDREDPRVVGVFLFVYAAANILAAAVFGARWFERGDG